MNRKHTSFESAMSSLGVTPLGGSGKVEHDVSKPAPSNAQSAADEARVLEETMAENPHYSSIQWESDEEYCKPGFKRKDFVRLKQGKFARQDEIHLRGYTVDVAHRKLETFIRDSVNAGYSCVKIIHGKGMNSPDGVSVIKLNTQKALTLNKFVLAYCKAVPADGGAGAKYALLKKNR